MLSQKNKCAGLRENGVNYVKIAIQNGSQPIFQKNVKVSSKGKNNDTNL